MKKFVQEFKKFITRGNVIDLAVGVIIGSAFTAIVNALTKNILTPFINWLLTVLLGKDSLSNVFTYLKKVEVDGVIDLTQSIYIDWGSLINAIINFILIAFVLFLIVKTINALKEGNERIKTDLISNIPTKNDRKEMRALGIKLSDDKAVDKFMDDKRAKEKADADAAALIKQAEEAEAKKHSTEGLLEDIKALLENKIK